MGGGGGDEAGGRGGGGGWCLSPTPRTRFPGSQQGNGSGDIK